MVTLRLCATIRRYNRVGQLFMSTPLVECRRCQWVATVGDLCLYHWQEQTALEQPYAHFFEEE